MQIISVLAAISATPALADFSSMVDTFSKLAENYTYNFDDDFAGMRSAQAPELQGTVPGSQGLVFLKNLWNYGCWCRFEEMHGTGMGAPVNKMDEVCRTLHHGYTCMQHDDGECAPFGQKYRSVVHSAESKDTMVIDCASKNPNGDECNHRACAVESWFVLEILRLYFKEKYAFDPAFMAPLVGMLVNALVPLLQPPHHTLLRSHQLAEMVTETAVTSQVDLLIPTTRMKSFSTQGMNDSVAVTTQRGFLLTL